MNTSTISAVVNNAPANPGVATQTESPETDASGRRFSDVMTDQHVRHASRAEPASTTGKATAAKKDKAETADATNAVEPGTDATAALAANQPNNLPEIALNIAAQAASVLNEQSLPADASPNTARGVPPQTRPDALPAGLIQAPPVIQAAPVGNLIRPTTIDGTAAQRGPNERGKVTQSSPSRIADNSNAKLPQSSSFLKTLVANNTDSGVNATPDPLTQSSNLAATSAAANGAAMLNASPAFANSTGLSGASAQTMTLGIATPLQNPQWANDFGRQFVTFTQMGPGKPHTAELRLDPPELGPIRISINISDNVAAANFMSPHAAVRQAIENALPQLQQQLAQAGISLGQTNVSDHGQASGEFQQSAQPSRKAGAITPASGTAGEPLARAESRAKAANALVDTFA